MKQVILNIFKLFIILSVITGCNNASDTKYTITFQVIVKNSSQDQRVFISGNQPELGNWNPAEIPLQRINDSLFTKTVSFSKGTKLQYKITAGNWWLEALDSSEVIYRNFVHKVRQDSLLSATVYGWSNSFQNGMVVLDQKRFNSNRPAMALDDFWKYHPGDDPAWAGENYDDSGWEVCDTYINWKNNPRLSWENVGWFRLHFIADTSLWNKSLALLIEHLGASQIYYNGKLLYSFGRIGTSAAGTEALQGRIWKEIRIAAKSENVLAIRYANYAAEAQQQVFFSPGFVLYLKNINTVFQQVQEKTRVLSNHQMIFTVIPLILFVLHIFIFSFNPGQSEHLYYAISLLGFAGVTYFNFEKAVLTNPDQIVLIFRLNGISVPIAMFFGLMTFYAMQYTRLPRRWMWYLLPFILLSVLNFSLMGNRVSVLNYVFFAIIVADIIISTIRQKGDKNPRGGWIVSTGLAILFIFVIFQILLDFALIESVTGNNQVFVYGVIGLAISMSLYLSYNFSLINKDLAIQIVRVRELSEKTIVQERETNRLEMERQVADAEHIRKTRELEEARNLQLSLLPAKIPESNNFDLSFYMNTAVEVGGDYYDIISAPDGNFIIAVGDATGHGVKAGIMVAIVKSLIYELDTRLAAATALDRINTVIQSLNLGNLYMGLTMIRLSDAKLSMEISSAGMPPSLLFRKSEARIEEIILKRMPLGATNRLIFESRNIKMNRGDILLVLSDGLSELFNHHREMFEYERIKEILFANSEASASAIIEKLKDAAEKWRNGFDQADDLTFGVIKCKTSQAEL